MNARPAGGSLHPCPLAALLSAVTAALLVEAGEARGAALAVRAPDDAIVQSANLALGLQECEVFSLPLQAAAAPGAMAAVVPVDGFPVVLDLEPYSVRGAAYRVLVQQPDGSLLEAPPSAVHTMRGEVLGMPGSMVAASVDSAGLHARVLFADGAEYWIEPLGANVPEAGAGDHVGYYSSAVAGEPGVCGTDEATMTIDAAAVGPVVMYASTAEGFGACVAEVACDADFEFYQHWGSVAAVENRINEVMNAINIQYQRDVGIAHLVTTIVVRTSSNDPYTTSDPSTLLSQFRSHWSENHSGIQRDVAHLFTGRDLTGSTIGIAWVGAICSSYGYGLSQSSFSSNFASVTDLTAHEMGHNWGAGHCSCVNYTMNAWLTSTNQFDPATSIPQITQFRDGLTCLGNCDGGPALECGDQGTGSCLVAHTTPFCDDADCCTVVCAADPSCCDSAWDESCVSLAAALCDGGGGDDDAPQDAPLGGYELIHGAAVAGGIVEMDDSDDLYFTVGSVQAGERQKSSAVVSALSPITGVSRLDVTIESGSSGSSVTCSVFFWNFNRGTWIKQSGGSQPRIDTVQSWSVETNPSRFLDPATGEMRIKVLMQRSGTVPFTLRIDHVQVTATP
jgi:hypothetical protein